MANGELQRLKKQAHSPFVQEVISWLFITSQHVGFPTLVAWLFMQFRSNARFAQLRWPFLAYLLYAFGIDQSNESGGKPWPWLQNHPIWQGYKNYFPGKTILDFTKQELESKFGYRFDKNEEGTPILFDKNGERKLFVIGMHPHGIISHASVANWFIKPNPMEWLGDISIGTIDLNVMFPFWREVMLWMGSIRVNKKGIFAALDKGKHVGIIVGGAEEAVETKPGNGLQNLKLKDRKGFVKVALSRGAALIPSYNFGETELYEELVANPPGSMVREVQTFLKGIFGYTLPLFRGRWNSGYPFRVPLLSVVRSSNFIERRANFLRVLRFHISSGYDRLDFNFSKHISTELNFRFMFLFVITNLKQVGKPIDLPKIEIPTQDEIDRYHGQYVTALEELYHRYNFIFSGHILKIVYLGQHTFSKLNFIKRFGSYI